MSEAITQFELTDFDSSWQTITTTRGMYSPNVAWLTRPQQRVCIKRLRDVNLQNNTEARTTLEAYAKLDHDNIVKLLGVTFSHIGQSFTLLVFDNASHGTLSQYIHTKQQVYSNEQAFDWMIQAASALDYLHKHNILYKNMNTSHMLLTTRKNDCQELIVMLRDNTQILSNREVTNCLSKNMVYISPELLKGDAYCKADDVYTFGICVWEVLTRKHPFNISKDNARGVAPMLQRISQGLRLDTDDVIERVHEPSHLIEIVLRSCWLDTVNMRPSARGLEVELKECRQRECQHVTMIYTSAQTKGKTQLHHSLHQ
jgi:serine/threonine protein kinase